MQDRFRPTGGGPNDPADPESISRRKFLMDAGKYSAAAAFAMAGSSLLFSGCNLMGEESSDDDDGSNGGAPSGGTSFDSASTLNSEQSVSVALTMSENVKYFKYDLQSQPMYLVLSGISGYMELQVYDSDHDPVSDVLEVEVTEGWLELSEVPNGMYYFRFDGCGSSCSFTLLITATEQYSDYSDYGDYSDYSDYSDWSNWSNWTGNWSGDWIGQYACQGVGCSCSCQTYGVYY